MSPLDIKAPGPPKIYLVGPLAILDPHINICVGPPNTCVALKQFNLLPPNTLFWSNFIYYPLTHQFEAITLGWIKTCVKWFWDNFDWDWQTETWVIVNPELLNSRVALYFPCDLNHPLKFDWQTGRPKDKHVGGSNTFETSYI